jgi:hypothetical protein
MIRNLTGNAGERVKPFAIDRGHDAGDQHGENPADLPHFPIGSGEECGISKRFEF